jgi:hypothetical protein
MRYSIRAVDTAESTLTAIGAPLVGCSSPACVYAVELGTKVWWHQTGHLTVSPRWASAFGVAKEV